MTELKVKDFKEKQVSGMARAYQNQLGYELIDLPMIKEVEREFMVNKLESLENRTKSQLKAEIETLKKKYAEVLDEINFHRANEFWTNWEG